MTLPSCAVIIGSGCRSRSTQHASVGASSCLIQLVARMSSTQQQQQRQQQLMQVRTYIPPAYRSGRNRLTLVKPSKRIGGRSSRMKNLFDESSSDSQTMPGAVASNESGVLSAIEIEPDNNQGQYYHPQERRMSEGVKFALQRQKHDLLKIARQYFSTLRQGQESAKEDKQVLSLTELLKTLHKSEDGVMISVSYDALVQSELLFRNLCQLLQDMVIEWSRQANTSYDDESVKLLKYLFGENAQLVAEELLLSLSEVRMDRAALVQAAMLPVVVTKPTTPTTQLPSVIKKIGSWVGKVLGLPAVNEETKKDSKAAKQETIELLAHSDPKYSVSRDHLATVLQNMAAQTQDAFNINDTTRGITTTQAKNNPALKQAKRMTLLLEQCTANSNVSPDTATVNHVLQAWAQVGTLRGAQEAERICTKFNVGNDWGSSFNLVLLAYRNAAMGESSKETKLSAVMRATELIKQRVRTSPPVLNTSNERPRTHAFIILLESFQCAGVEVIPDMGKKAHQIMKLYMDEKSLGQLEGNDKSILLGIERLKMNSPIPDLDLLNALVLTYAMTGEREHVRKAVRLLNILLDARRNTEWSRLVPTAQSVDGLVRALAHMKRLWLDADDKQCAIFATELVDILYRMDNQLPLAGTFHHILQLWENSKAFEAPDKAEEILSRLEIRAALHTNRSSFINRSTYHMVLNCWREASRIRPGAAQKALRLLEKMDAQASPYSASFTLPSEVQDIAANSYNEDVKPNEDTYLLVLQTCFNSQLASDKEAALTIALDVYSRMSERGIRPSDNVVNTMLIGCKMLAPEDTEKRAALARTIYDIARDSGLGRKKEVLRSILSTASPGVISSNKL